MTTSYDRLPEHMREHARAYVEDHEPVGGFLTAVLSNNLVEAFGRADSANREAMADWAMWLFNDIPAPCWGSPEKVAAWLRVVSRCPVFDCDRPVHKPDALCPGEEA